MRPLAHPFFRPDRLVPFALLAAGSLAFIGGGRRHPVINAGALGTSGPDEFFRAFAHEMVHTARWEQMHMLILAGPVLWALGAAAASRLLPRRIAALGEVGRAALLLAAAGWALAFILDGSVGPRYAAVIDAGGPDATSSLITAFGLSQLTMARLGTVSIVLIGAAIFAYSMALLATNRLVSGRAVVGAIGLLVGGWPLLAAARGEFSPGPFTSPFWMMTAASIGIWMMLFAAALPDPAPTPGATSLAAPPT